MAVEITHEFINLHEDGEDETVTKPSNWNEKHVIKKLLGYSLVEEKELSAGSTGYTFSGLDGDTDKEYLIEAELNIIGTNPVIVVKPNNQTSTFVSGDGAFNERNMTGNQSWGNIGFVFANYMWGIVNPVFIAEMKIKAKTGKGRMARNEYSLADSTKCFNGISSTFWTDSVANITSLVVLISPGTGEGTIRLWKKIPTS